MTGDDLKAIRAKTGLRQEDFAKILGIHPITLSKWEGGGELKLRSFHAGILHTMADAPGYDHEDIAHTFHTKGPLAALKDLLEVGLRENGTLDRLDLLCPGVPKC